MRGRGVAPVLGLVLLIGFVVAGALAMFTVGVTIVDSSQSEVETSQVEQSMLTAAETADEMATGERSSATWSFDGAGDGTPSVDEDAGRINITQYVDGEPETVVLDDASMGTLTFEHDDTQYAYQAGGVWRLDDRGEPRLVRAPELHYNERTLTFPFVNVTGDVTAGQYAGSMHVTETENVYPNAPDHFNPLRNGTIVIEIESEYCQGWESYFDQRTDGALLERCGETGATEEGELRVELIVPFTFEGTGENAVVAENITEGGNANVTGSTGDGDYPSATDLIERKLDDCEDGSGEDLVGTDADEPGLYCSDGMDGEYSFDPSDGDIEVAVDGPMDAEGIEIEGTDGEVTLFVQGDVLTDVQGSTVIGDETAPERLNIMVHSEYDVGDSGWGNTEVYALIYAPESTIDIDGGGTPEIEGAIIGDEVNLRGNTDVDYDAETANQSFEYDVGGKSIYYLHVTETEIRFTDD